MIIDLHVHTRRHSGCSCIEPSDVVGRAKEAGLDGVVLTEHGILWKEERLAPLGEQALERGLLLLAAEEVTCFEKGRRQDFLVFGLEESLGGSLPLKELLRRVRGEGGVVVAAHPFKPSRLGEGYHGVGESIYDLDVDAVELYHPDHDEEARKKVRHAANALGIPMTGGSDAHELHDIGTCSTRFESRVRTIEELVEEIRAGRIEPLNGLPVR